MSVSRLFQRNHLPPALARAGCVLVIATAILLVGCGNPRKTESTNAPAVNSPAANVPPLPALAEKVALQPAYVAGTAFRTTRTLRVEELTETERFLTEGSEITLSRVRSVDDRGRILGVERSWEASTTRHTRGFGAPEEATGELHGCTLELRRRQGGVETRLITGKADIRGQTLLIDGFEYALLPLDPVAEGARWALGAGAIAGLNRFVEALGYKLEKNLLTCVLARVTPESAEVVLDWHLSGELNGRAAVLQFKGRLVFDRQQKLVSAFALSGGRAGGQGQQIEINVKRRLVEGWLDLDE